MNMALACTWQPRGELPRLYQLLPQLEQVYASMVVAVRPGGMDEVQSLNAHPKMTLFEMPAPGWGRYLAIQNALTTDPDYIHYADLDLLLHWVECNPQEWRETTAAIQQADCLIIGRTARALQTRPQAIQQTERIINMIFSHVLGQTIDFGLGARGFSQRAAQCVIQYSAPGRWGDAEWPILIQRAGLSVTYCAVDGVDWETPDRYRTEIADPATRQKMADAYDREATKWGRRVQIAQEIVQQGLAATHLEVGKPR